MSTAVIISGQLRSFARCYPSQKWQVFRHYEKPPSQIKGLKTSGFEYWKQEEPHFFVSCVDDENAASAELLRQHYQNVHIEKFTDPTDLPEVPIEYGAYAPYANATSHAKLMLQHWSNKRAWEFFKRETLPKQEKIRNQAGNDTAVATFRPELDVIIRMRPDNFFHRYIPPAHLLMNNDALTPWWGKFGGINDRFAIMGYKAAEAYFTTYDRIPELLAMGCPFHPESLVAASLRAAGVAIKTDLMTSFSTMRVNGEQRWPEITNDDIAELIAGR